MRVFCFGFGYVAQHLAAALQADGIPVSGTARLAEKAALFGGHVMRDDQPLDAEGRAALEEATHVLVTIPPGEGGVDSAWRHHHDTLRSKPWLGYLSTTGVYGDHNGDWVTEASPLLAAEPRSLHRIAAEQRWLECGAHVFRLGGIYGRGRNALEQVRSGTAKRIHKEGQFFSRIHVEDIVQVLRASAKAPQSGQVYNITDDEPSPAHEVIAYACHLLGRECPPLIPFESADLSPMARSFYMGSRKVSNRKIKESLRIALRYPTYREGLASILQAETEFDIATPIFCR